MKLIAVTHRVDIHPDHGERRDAIDQRWTDFLLKVGLWPVFLPNHRDYVHHFLETEGIDGILLTGGNSLARYNGDAPERDAVESALLEWAGVKAAPVLGVCRGMQVIQDHFGVTLTKIEGHVGTRHVLDVVGHDPVAEILRRLKDVNAFHHEGTHESQSPLSVLARSKGDDVVMAIHHDVLPIFGVMWHSEREDPFTEPDLALFREVFRPNA